MANILIDLINEIADDIVANSTSDGFLLISAFRDENQESVVQKFRDLGLFLNNKLSDEGWSALLFKKP